MSCPGCENGLDSDMAHRNFMTNHYYDDCYINEQMEINDILQFEQKPRLQRNVTEFVGSMDKYFMLPPTFQKTIFIDGLGEVYVPENYTIEEIKLLGKMVLDGKMSIDCLQIKKNSIKHIQNACDCKEPCFCHPNKWAHAKNQSGKNKFFHLILPKVNV